MDPLLKTKEIYSVLELNNAVKGVLNREFPDAIWVHGEIQDYNRNKYKQHIFFELCEKHPEIDQIIAKVTAVIFENKKDKIMGLLEKAENRFELQDGIEVKLLCRVDLYPRSGNFTVIVENIDPIYTIGRLAQNRQKIITELKAKGILDKNKMLTIPVVALNIGLITSYGSAAYHDFLDELKKSNYAFKIWLFNSSMQGKNVEQDVCSALEIFDRYNFLDGVVITRGGGSTADLSWFDNAKIAERIALSRLPILSGIGHDINVTITDMAAHTFMKTPTAIAQFLTRNIESFLSEIEDKTKKIIYTANSRIQSYDQELRILSVNTNQATIGFLRTHRENIVNKSSVLKLGTHNFIDRIKTGIFNRSCDLSLQTNQLLKNFKISSKSLKDKRRQIKSVSLSILKSAERTIKNYENAADIADPLNTVKRGFSITRTKEGVTVRSIKDVKVKEDLITTICDGIIQSEVKRKEKRDDQQ